MGSALLDWQIGRARQLLAGSGKEGLGRILVHVEEGMADASSMLVERGFRQIRHYTEMLRDLRLPIPDGPRPRHLVLVPWQEELEDKGRMAHNEALDRHDWCEPHN